MTKVEELRERLIQAIGTYGVAEDKGMPSELCETLDSLIAAAREEGAEQMVQKIQKASYRCKPGETLHINNSIPMLVLVSSVVNPEDTDFEPKHYRCIWNKEPFGSCEDYRKAGGQAEHCPWFEDKALLMEVAK